MLEIDIYRQLFHRNPQPMWVYDLDTLRFLAVNEAAVRAYGWSEAEFMTMTILQIRPPEEAAKVARVIADLQSGPHSFGIWRHQRKDGAIMDVEVSGDEIQWKGRRARLTLVNDVTARRRAEQETIRLGERLTATVESI